MRGPQEILSKRTAGNRQNGIRTLRCIDSYTLLPERRHRSQMENQPDFLSGVEANLRSSRPALDSQLGNTIRITGEEKLLD